MSRRISSADIISHIQKSEAFAKASSMLAASDVQLTGLYGGLSAAWVYALSLRVAKPFWVVCANDDSALDFYKDLSVWGKNRSCLYLSLLAEESDALAQRQRALLQMEEAGPYCLVTSVAALAGPVLDGRNIKEACVTCVVGQNTDPLTFSRALVKAGYERTQRVEVPGEFAVRGGICDVFALGDPAPVRIEFEDKVVESMRWFDPVSHRSGQNLTQEESLICWPCWELSSRRAKKDSPWLPHALYRYMPQDLWAVLKDPAAVRQALSGLLDKEGKNILDVLADKPKRRLSFALVSSEEDGQHKTLALHVRGLMPMDHSAEQLRRSLAEWQDFQDALVVFAGRNAKEHKHFQDFLTQHAVEMDMLENPLALHSSGFIWEDGGLVVVTGADLFPAPSDVRDIATHSPRKMAGTGFAINRFEDLREGDHVVHLSHGIAIFRGIKRLSHGDVVSDHLALEYHGGDMLYVPLEQIHLVQKYLAFDAATPKLHKLGGLRWRGEKETAEKAIRDMAAQILQVQATRAVRQGYCYGPKPEWEEMFARSFPFEETPDQARAIADVRADMESTRPMDRLICGDVGFGKTEIAMRAAFKAVAHHKQVAVLAPTTVLALQHFRNFEQRMREFPVRVAMLSRFKTKAEQKEILSQVKAGQVDIVVGTHRLLQNDVHFSDLGLLVVDEEQRFGVAHKEKIKHYRHMVDILTLSATPIPRTLYLSLTGMREMSVIHTAPRDRLPVRTEVCSFDDAFIAGVIQRELDRQGQVFFIHNRVRSIYQMAEKIRKLVPKARLEVGHGQMDEKDLEKTVMDFVDHRFDVFVCTTIIESGVDIPNANTIIIDNADTFGLADLYQLRGRVGRFTRKAYAYLLVDGRKILQPDAQERLQAIQDLSGLGAGYRVAMRDLELRGAGNVLGKEQHGHIARIGFDLYSSLLRKQMKLLKGESPDVTPCHVDLKWDVVIDHELIPKMSERLEVYRRFASVGSEQDLREVKEELSDLYGQHWPESLKLLHDVSALRVTAGMKGYTHIGRRKDMLDLVSRGTLLCAPGHRAIKLPAKDMSASELLDFVWSQL